MKSTVLKWYEGYRELTNTGPTLEQLTNKSSLQHTNTRQKSVETIRENKGPQQMSGEQSSGGDEEAFPDERK